MKYKILETRQSEDTLITVVEYDFDGIILTVDVPHFQPQNKSDIITGIENRAFSEKIRAQKASLIPTLVSQLEIGKKTDILPK